MGLLDFISKSSSAPQDGQTDPSTQPTAGMSDIQYPIPQTTPDSGTMPVLPPASSTSDYSQYTYDPSKIAAADITKNSDTNEVADITQTPTPDFYNQNLQNIEDLTQYGVQQPQAIDSSSTTDSAPTMPTETTNSPDISALQPEAPLTAPVETSVVANNQPLPSMDGLEAQSQVASTQPMSVLPEPAAPETPVIPQQAVENTIAQQPTDAMQALDINNLVSDAPSMSPTMPTNQPAVPVASAQTPLKTEEVKNEAYDLVFDNKSIGEPVAEEKTETMEVAQPPVQPEPEVTVSATAQPEVVNEPVAVPEENNTTVSDQKIEEVKEEPNEIPAVESAPINSDYEFKKIKNVAFLGLNSKTFKNVSSEVRNLANTLASKNFHIYIDSNKGYGEDIISVLESSSNKAKLTSVYFKPFYSSYTDEAEKKNNITDLTTVIYSDLIERTKYFIRESEAFIFPETSGLVNSGLLNLLLSIQYLYSGQHKPVILLGNKWAEKIEQMKAVNGFSDDEVKSIKIVATADEAFKLLSSEDDVLSKDSILKSRKFFDYREDFDEYEYMN